MVLFNMFLISFFFFFFFTEKNFSDSQYHFLFTSDGQQCAAMLIENATTQGYPGEADLFVAQAVLQYVSFFSARFQVPSQGKKNFFFSPLVYWTSATQILVVRK